MGLKADLPKTNQKKQTWRVRKGEKKTRWGVAHHTGKGKDKTNKKEVAKKNFLPASQMRRESKGFKKGDGKQRR